METCVTLKDILFNEAEKVYSITEKLFRCVDDAELSWKPPTGKNWMTIGQLMMHCACFGCGKAFVGFVKDDWGFAEGSLEETSEYDLHVPPAEVLTSVESVSQALELLSVDRNLTMNCIAEVEENKLLSVRLIAPWGGSELSLFQHLTLMIAHLNQHKGQLFYYLKLMGKDLNTTDLWGS